MGKPIDAFDRPVASTAVLKEGTSGAAARADHDHGDGGSSYTDPLTTKGDLLGRSATATVRTPVGADNLFLRANSAAANGVDWSAAGGIAGAQLINDDLSTTTNLQTALNGTWAINAGVLRQSGTGVSASHISHSSAVTPASCRIAEVGAKYVSGSGGIQRMGLIVSSTNANSGNLLVYANTADNGASWLVVIENDGVSAFANTGISYAGSGYVRLGAVLTGTALDVYVDGVWVLMANTSFSPGKYVGLYTYSCVADFHNLKAWTPIVSPL